MDRKRTWIDFREDMLAELQEYSKASGTPAGELLEMSWRLWNDMRQAREDPAHYQRLAAIHAYQAAHPFIEDGDDTPTQCPSCGRTTTKAGLVHAKDAIYCDGCYPKHPQNTNPCSVCGEPATMQCVVCPSWYCDACYEDTHLPEE